MTTGTMYRVIQTDGKMRRLFACRSVDGLEAWTAIEAGAQEWTTAAAAEQEAKDRHANGHYLRGYTVKVVPGSAW